LRTVVVVVVDVDVVVIRAAVSCSGDYSSRAASRVPGMHLPPGIARTVVASPALHLLNLIQSHLRSKAISHHPTFHKELKCHDEYFTTTSTADCTTIPLPAMASDQPTTATINPNGLPEEVVTCLQNARFVSICTLALVICLDRQSLSAYGQPLRNPYLILTKVFVTLLPQVVLAPCLPMVVLRSAPLNCLPCV
jgi:hypothetical protein